MAVTKALRRRLPWVIVAGVLLALVLWWALGGRARHVETVKVQRGPAVELVYATGYVEAQHPVSVSARLTAPVQQVLIAEGAPVAKGQALILLDSAEQHGLLAQAEAQARGASLAEQRTVTLFRQGWVTRAARDEAVAAGEAARASVAALRARLDQATVRAGISGVVLKRDVEPGDLATPGKELLQLGDPASARVTATVDERDIPRVRVGQDVLMATDAMPGKVVRGRVTEITPGGDPNQRAFRVRIGLDDASALPFGLTLEVNIVTERRANTLLVPAGAVVSDRVWTVRDGRARNLAVKTGVEGGEKVEILSGLREGDAIIANPPDGLEDGDRVRP